MSLQYTPTKAIPNQPLYDSCIINIKQKARSWGISSQNFDLDFALINSQIRVHGAYGAYNELEKLWHVEFYTWSKYCTFLVICLLRAALFTFKTRVCSASCRT